MNKLYTGVLPDKLVDEIQAAGLLEQEKMSFFPKEDGLEIRFNEVGRVILTAENTEGEEIEVGIAYEKLKTFVYIDSETREEKSYEDWVDYTTEFEIFLAEIQAVVDVHDPTPYPTPNPNLTIEERVDQMELTILQMNGVI